ncbi:MAG TPA: hypothetical protein VNE16_06775 [Vicinamibacterales bacterium]|nr:hypothetical protein [Vicinamibacterales bacterium]
MARDFTICVVSPPDYRHVLAFAELAEALLQALEELGHAAAVTWDPAAAVEGRAIVLAPHLIPHAGWTPPPGAVLYNLEQAADSNEWFTPAYRDLLRRHEVWDYAQGNLAFLAGLGIAARLVPIGYAPCLARIAPAATEDIDVLAYGTMSDRRIAVLDALRRRGLKVVRLFNVYGARRDSYIARAKIVLNIHTYEARLFEIVRVSYLLANGRCVVSEEGSDAALEAPYRDAVTFSPYEALVDATLALAADPEARARRAEAGRAIFGRHRQSDFLAPVVGRKPAAPTP